LLGGSDESSEHHLLESLNMGQTQKATGPISTWYLQLEDCGDVLKVLYPQFDFLFLFDHSCRHNCQKEDGLNVERMTKSYGGAQNG